MNYYSFHIGDYHLATAHLEPMEDLAYRRLIDFYYQTESPIPRETQQVSRRLRLGLELVNSVLSEFFIETEKGWINARCDEEIAKYIAKQDISKQNGKLGGRPKKQELTYNEKPRKTQKVILANPEITGSQANQEPITNNQEPKEKQPEYSLPEWMPKSTWEEFKKMRVSIKSKLTPHAEQLALKKLAGFLADGYDPVEAVENAIMNSWKSVYLPDKKSSKSSAMEGMTKVEKGWEFARRMTLGAQS